MIKTTAIIVAVLLAGILIFAATRPDTFRVQRSTSIKAPTLIMWGMRTSCVPSTRSRCSACTGAPSSPCFLVRAIFAPMERPDWIVSMTRAFFNASMPEAKK